jgi:hypothetical protein
MANGGRGRKKRFPTANHSGYLFLICSNWREKMQVDSRIEEVIHRGGGYLYGSLANRAGAPS